jgi:aminopeptidase N
VKIVSTLSLFLLVVATAHAQPAPPAPGVTFDLAVHRAATISNLRYDLSLTIPKALDAPVTGTTRITFELRDNSSPLVIDFETSRDHVRSVKTGDAVVLFEYVNGHIVLPAAVLKVGRNVVEIAFDAGNEPLNRSADFLYALFVPARARQAIPVFDQPDLKARWKLNLTYPAEWRAVSNGAEGASRHQRFGHRSRQLRRRCHPMLVLTARL